MSSTEYYVVWLVYLSSSAIAIACFWWLTQFIKHETARLLLRLPAIAIAITPAQHAADSSLYSPAIAAAAIDFIALGWEGARVHVNSLLFAIIASLILVLIINFLRSKSLIK